MSPSLDPRDRPLLSVAVAAELAGVTPGELGRYEAQGFIAPARTATSRRRYSMREVQRVQQVRRLLAEFGVNAAGATLIVELLEQMSRAGVRPDGALAGLVEVETERS